MSIPIAFVIDDPGGDLLIEAAMLAVPRENDVLEHAGKEYAVGPARWCLSKTPEGVVLAHVVIVVEPTEE